MVDIYISWVKGLTENKKAMRILRDSGLISGIEFSNIDETFERVKDAGLKVSSHLPGLNLTLNLADPNYMYVFESEQGERIRERILKIIRESDAPTVGFHLGYSAEKVYKMNAFPNVPVKGTLLTDRQQLLERITKNVVALERKINEALPEEKQKRIVLETLDYSRLFSIPWKLQLPEIVKHKEEIRETVIEYGQNAAVLYVTDPDFVKEVLDIAGNQNIKPIGFLFDVAHVFIAGDGRNDLKFMLTHSYDYMLDLLNAINGRTYQMHLNVPNGDKEIGYSDHHNPFNAGDELSENILFYTKRALKDSPELQVITLEMRTRLSPIEHAREMIRQAEYLKRELEF